MLNEKNIINIIKSSNRHLGYKIKGMKFYAKYKSFIDIFLNCGIVLEKAAPFILSTVIMTSVYNAAGNRPFIRDEVETAALVETIDMKNNFHREYISLKNTLQKEYFKIQYTTGWELNNNIYERTITTFKINDKLMANDYKYILSLSYDEIINNLEIENVETIRKNNLLPDDIFYFEDTPIISEVTTDDNLIMYAKEPAINNNVMSLWYIVTILFGGKINKLIIEYFYHGPTLEKCKKQKLLTKELCQQEILNMETCLELERENLEMVLNNNNLSEKYTKSLRRR